MRRPLDFEMESRKVPYQTSKGLYLLNEKDNVWIKPVAFFSIHMRRLYKISEMVKILSVLKIIN